MSQRLEELRAALSGRYEVDKEIGQGGMATVYLASDVRHNRQVAVKVLRPDLAAALGPERFLREIEIAANLTHPHILPLHDSGEADGFLYYVMPYIKGYTLRDRIEKEGELPVSEAVRIIREVTDALAFAHSQGVVHRDIKPDNVMLSGRHAMVMDFGVAKAVSEATGRNTLTTAGVALGTPTYMAPEQATADPHVDHRADIYAIGVMAYELLAGRTPFQGASPQAVLAAHVTQEAEPVSRHRDQVSGELEGLVMKCLAKKPADRWQSADEMLPLLETMTTTSGGLTPTATRPVQTVAAGPRRRVWWMAAGAVAAVVVIAVYGATLLTDDGLSISVTNVRQLTHSPMLEIEPEVSPDGGEVLYTAGYPGAFHLQVRSVEGGPALQLTETLAGDQQLAEWNPSGGSIEFVNNLITPNPQFYQISKFGGQPTAIREFTMAQTDIHAWFNNRVSMWQVDRESGDTVAQWPLPPGAFASRLSPDRSRVAYVVGNAMYYVTFWVGNVAPSSIWIFNLGDSSTTRVTDDEHLNQHPVWLSKDVLLFVSNRDGRRDAYAIEVPTSGEPSDEPVRLTTGAEVHTTTVSDDGSLMAYSQLRFRANLYEITLPDTGSVSIGDARPLTRQNHSIENHDRSSDGQRLTYDSDISGDQEIYVVDTPGAEPRAITANQGQDMDPMFSPDGSDVVFYSTRHGSRDLFLVPTNGGGPIRLTGLEEDGWAANNHEMLPAFSPDGLHLAFISSTLGPARVNRIMVMSRDTIGGAWGAARLLADSAFATVNWAPDGRRLVFDDNDGIDLVTLEGVRQPLVDQRTMAQSAWPVWAQDNRIYFRGVPNEGIPGIYFVDMSAIGDATPEPQLVVRFDVPSVVSASYGITVVGNSLVLNVDEKESDIFLMDLEY